MALVISVDSQPTLAFITLEGDLDTKSAPQLLEALSKISLPDLQELSIQSKQLSFMSSAGLRVLVFAKQKMPHTSKLNLVDASDSIKEVIVKTGLSSAITLVVSSDS